MIATLATLVFATAGCASAAVIGTSIRNALPKVRDLLGETRAQRQALAADPLALDRVYLVSLIESPLHDGTRPPVPVIAVPATGIIARIFGKRVAKGQAHRGARPGARRFTAARYHVAA